MITKNYMALTCVIFFASVANCQVGNFLDVIKSANDLANTYDNDLQSVARILQSLNEDGSSSSKSSSRSMHNAGNTLKTILKGQNPSKTAQIKKAASILQKSHFEKSQEVNAAITSIQQNRQLSPAEMVEYTKLFQNLVKGLQEIRRNRDWLNEVLVKYVEDHNNEIQTMKGQEEHDRKSKLFTFNDKVFYKHTNDYDSPFQVRNNEYLDWMNNILIILKNRMGARKSQKTAFHQEDVTYVPHPTKQNDEIPREKFTFELAGGKVLTLYLSSRKPFSTSSIWVFVRSPKEKRLVPVQLFNLP